MDCPEGDSTRFRLPPDVLRYEIAGTKLAAVRFCWRGKTHQEDGSPCQDWAAVFPDAGGEGGSNSLLAVVADGVSTQPRSGEGAKLAAQALGECMGQLSDPAEPPASLLVRAQARFVALCQEHQAMADSADDPASSAVVQYATTALVLWLRGESAWAASVGDGAIYAISDGGRKATLMTIIQREGYAHEVRPLTSEHWQNGFAESAPNFQPRREIEGYCLMTDGLSESVGDANKYFEAVWPQLKQRLQSTEELTEYAQAFCSYWEERKFSDDDKTLLALFLER
jgi:hypothetical protein